MAISKTPSKATLEKRTKSQSRQIRSLKENAKKAPVSSAIATVGGAALVGATKAKVGDTLLGAPIEPVGGAIAAAAGLLMGRPELISFAAGWVAPYIADQTEQALS